MAVQLREITPANRAFLEALAVAPFQDAYVGGVAISLQERDSTPEAAPWYRGIYDGETPVGFVMISDGITPENLQRPELLGPYFLWRLLIDHRFQGRGYGAAAIALVVDHLRAANPSATELLTSCQPGPHTPLGFYLRLGFRDTGTFHDGEHVLSLDLTVASRWRSVDPLLPLPCVPADVTPLAVPDAVGVARRLSPGPGEPSPLWFAAHRFVLRPLVTDPSAMDALLTSWRATLPDASDSAGYVYVPSRDTAVIPSLIRHGLVPYSVLAVRTVARPVAATVPVRRAGAADLDALTELIVAQYRSEIEFGTAVDRPDAEPRLQAEVVEALAAQEPWAWVAEADGRLLGALTAEPPASTGWLAGFTDLRPLAYLRMARVVPDSRSGGIGTALTAAAHTAFDEAGVAATLLHYSLLNPRSGPFWHRAGYRPLWTTWKTTAPSAAGTS